MTDLLITLTLAYSDFTWPSALDLAPRTCPGMRRFQLVSLLLARYRAYITCQRRLVQSRGIWIEQWRVGGRPPRNRSSSSICLQNPFHAGTGHCVQYLCNESELKVSTSWPAVWTG